jgi:predicted ATP-grasp superfamily ATP-dependent carboligase
LQQVGDDRRVKVSKRRRARQTGSAVGAVVLGGDYQGLAIVRSLGRKGIPVCVIDDEPSVARHSRYASHTARVPRLIDEAGVLQSVLDVGEQLGLEGWVLYPTRDEVVAALSHGREELERFFRVPTPPWTAVSWAWDKRLTYELAEELGVAVPKTWRIQEPAELSSLEAHLPLVIKPAIKEHFIYATNVKAWRADTREQLETLFRRAAKIVPAEEVMVQELIPGDGRCQFSYCGFFKSGHSVATMVVRRLRQRPMDFGRSSTFVETVDVPELEKVARHFLSHIGYYGLVEIEFKLDERDGQYKLLDVNPRTWGYHSLGPRAGTDFPLLLYRDQLGEPVESVRAALGIKWVRLSTDLPTALPELWAGRLSWRQYIRSLVSADVEGLFERDDLRPALVELALLPYLYRTRRPTATRVVSV